MLVALVAYACNKSLSSGSAPASWLERGARSGRKDVVRDPTTKGGGCLIVPIPPPHRRERMALLLILLLREIRPGEA